MTAVRCHKDDEALSLKGQRKQSMMGREQQLFSSTSWPAGV